LFSGNQQSNPNKANGGDTIIFAPHITAITINSSILVDYICDPIGDPGAPN